MGNQPTCCGVNLNTNNQQKYELSSKVFVLPASTSSQLDLEPLSAIVELPELNPDVLEVYEREKPFEEEFKQQPDNKKKQINSDVYFGPLDETDKPTKIGRLYKASGALLIANFLNGIARGPCFYIMPNGSYYKGEMWDNIAQCEYDGNFVTKNFKYRGGFKNNLFDGQGEQISTQKKCSFKGQYKEGKKVKGTMMWLQNDQDHKYTGSFDQNGLFTGKGTYTDPEGTYEGEFVNGKKHGNGVYYYKSKLKYQGQYFEGKKHGHGQITNFDGTIAYKGTFENGMPHGKGIATSRNGQVFEAEWDHGIDIRHLSEH